MEANIIKIIFFSPFNEAIPLIEQKGQRKEVNEGFFFFRFF